jgi:acyl carrier protein
LAVNWEGWERLWADEDEVLIGQQQNALMMTPEEVTAAFDRLLTLRGVPQVVVATGDLEARLRQWTQIGGTRGGEVPSSGVGAAGVRDSGIPYRAPSDPVQAKVAELWQRVLGIEQVGVDDDFFLFGGSSLSGLQILSELRGEYDVELPLRSFFEARTVAGMAELIVAEQERRTREEERMAAILAEIEALSDDEVESVLQEEEEVE